MIDNYKMPIRWLIPLLCALPAVLVAVVISTYLYISLSSQLGRHTNRNYQTLADNIAHSSEFAIQTKNTVELRKLICTALFLSNDVNEIEILDDASIQVTNCRRMVKIEGEVQSNMTPIYPMTSASQKAIGYVRISATSAIVDDEINQAKMKVISAMLVAIVLALALAFLLPHRFINALTELSGAAKLIASNNFDFVFSKILKGEIGQLQKSFLFLSRTASNFSKQLEENVKAKTKEININRNLLEKALTENKRLILRLNSAIEHERKSIALDLHDTFNTIVIAILGTVRRTKMLLKRQNYDSEGSTIRENLEEIELSANTLYGLARNLVSNLRPEELDVFGLSAALQDLIQKHIKADQDCQYTWEINGAVPKWNYDFNIAVYRIAQESLSNIAKHARATNCKITLTTVQHLNQTRLALSIIDNGVGFDISQRRNSTGLVGLRERAEGIGGILDITTSPGNGTKIMFSVDVPN